MKKRFERAFTPEEENLDFNVRPLVLTHGLFLRLQDIIGVSLRSSVEDILNQEEVPTLIRPLNSSDFIRMYPIVKYMHRISFEEGTALSKIAQKSKLDQNSRVKLLGEAQKKFKESVQAKPDDYRGTYFLSLAEKNGSAK